MTQVYNESMRVIRDIRDLVKVVSGVGLMKAPSKSREMCMCYFPLLLFKGHGFIGEKTYPP